MYLHFLLFTEIPNVSKASNNNKIEVAETLS